MTFFEALLLGLVGGIADFLPVGGTGHRILVERVFFGNSYSRGIRGDLSSLRGARGGCGATKGDSRLHAFSRPTGKRETAVGGVAPRRNGNGRPRVSLPFEDAYAGLSGDLVVVGVLLLVSGLLIYIAEEIGRRTLTLDSLKLPGATLIGLLGALAAVPGISRTGATISGGMLLGLTREAATRFALLFSVPLLVVSGLWDLLNGGGAGPGVSAAGAAASFVGAFLAVGFLRWYAREFSFMAFAYYLWVVGVFAIGYEYLG